MNTFAFGFGAEGHAVVGGFLTAGIAFDKPFSRYMFFEAVGGSLGPQVGGSVDLRVGFYSYDVYVLNGFYDTVEVSIGPIASAEFAMVYNWYDGFGMDIGFGVGINAGGGVTIGYTFDNKRGLLEA